jgi:hypothetical protein
MYLRLGILRLGIGRVQQVKIFGGYDFPFRELEAERKMNMLLNSTIPSTKKGSQNPTDLTRGCSQPREFIFSC